MKRMPDSDPCLNKMSQVLVDQVDGFIQGVDRQDAENRAKDLLLVSRHVGFHVGDDGGTDKVALGILVNLNRQVESG